MTRPLAPALARRVAAARAEGRPPVAVLDVDLTLLENAPRTRAIFVDWLHRVRDRWPGAEPAMVRAQTMPIVFSVRDNVAALGIDDPALAREAMHAWAAGFFTSHYCRRDAPLPGALDTVRALRAHDVTVAYLTARPSRMIEGTVARFAELGFPVGEPGTLLVMKDDPDEPDGAFKERALGWIGALGAVVVCADNEPGHVNAMARAFPNALALLVQTRHSPGAPALADGAVRAASLLTGCLDHDD